MSFSSEIKIMLSGLQIKRNCCKKALLFGLLASHSDSTLAFSTDHEKISSLTSWVFRQVYGILPYYETIGTHPSAITFYKMKPLDTATEEHVFSELLQFLQNESDSMYCPNCLSAFFRGLFLSSGTVSNPNGKGYHLEILFKSEQIRLAVIKAFETIGILPKQAVRKGSLSLYLKNSSDIEDFLTVIGAPHAALDLMNAKILREIRNNENRRSNCDASNIYRSTGAADIQLRAIKKLHDSGKLSLLPTDLQTTAKIRLDNPECNLAEIAALHEPPLTKSGVNHRLQRIVRFAEEETE